jgi:hypothetical protein
MKYSKYILEVIQEEGTPQENIQAHGYGVGTKLAERRR